MTLQKLTFPLRFTLKFVSIARKLWANEEKQIFNYKFKLIQAI